MKTNSLFWDLEKIFITFCHKEVFYHIIRKKTSFIFGWIGERKERRKARKAGRHEVPMWNKKYVSPCYSKDLLGLFNPSLKQPRSSSVLSPCIVPDEEYCALVSILQHVSLQFTLVMRSGFFSGPQEKRQESHQPKMVALKPSNMHMGGDQTNCSKTQVADLTAKVQGRVCWIYLFNRYCLKVMTF